MLRKTASGIKNFIECKGYGLWIMRLYVPVKSRASCQPSQGLEQLFAREENDEIHSGDLAPTIEAEEIPQLKEEKMDFYVPTKKKNCK